MRDKRYRVYAVDELTVDPPADFVDAASVMRRRSGRRRRRFASVALLAGAFSAVGTIAAISLFAQPRDRRTSRREMRERTKLAFARPVTLGRRFDRATSTLRRRRAGRGTRVEEAVRAMRRGRPATLTQPAAGDGNEVRADGVAERGNSTIGAVDRSGGEEGKREFGFER